MIKSFFSLITKNPSAKAKELGMVRLPLFEIYRTIE